MTPFSVPEQTQVNGFLEWDFCALMLVTLAPLGSGDLAYFSHYISGSRKGPAERGHVKKRQKSSKKCQKYFRHFSTFFAQGKKRQKSSKSVNIFFDTFGQFSRGTSFPAILGGSDHRNRM